MSNDVSHHNHYVARYNSLSANNCGRDVNIVNYTIEENISYLSYAKQSANGLYTMRANCLIYLIAPFIAKYNITLCNNTTGKFY